jgi:hypothetical protein
MSNYTKSTNFATKDNLTPGDPLKIVRGTEIDTEYNNIATAIATKTDNASAALTGGTINDTTIGATTASTGAFTTISATGAITSTLATGTAPLVVASTTKVTNLNVDSLDGADWASPAALGSTTPAAVSATTLSASGNVTLSGGTANGVAYLNGSKVVTSGSALTFSGQQFAISSLGDQIKISNSFGGTQQLTISSNAAGSVFSSHDGTNFVPIVWQSNTVEQMRLTTTGLGIGTSSPTAKLTVAGGRLQVTGNTAPSSGTGIELFYDGTSAGALAFARGTGYIPLAFDGSDIRFNTSSTERARIDSSGDFLVGSTSSTGERVQFLGTAGAGTMKVQVGADGNNGIGFRNASGTTVGSITVNASTTSYNTSSDQRLKENIQDAYSASSLIDSLQVRQYDWKTGGLHQRYGFVAQELVTVAPEAVHQPADPEEMMAVDYSKLVPMLVKEVQSLRKRLADAGI